MSLLQPGQHFEGLTIVDNPVFAAPVKPKRPSAAERFFASAVHAAQRAHDGGLAVTVDTMRMVVPELPMKQLAELMDSERFQLAMDELGIPLGAMPGLSPEQVAALAIYLDTSTPASHSQKLRAAGVTAAKWRGWLRQPLFAARLQDVAAQLVHDAVPMAQQRIAEAVDAGERWAIELTLEMTGSHDRRGDGQDARALLMAVFNVLDDEVQDPAVLARIAGRIKEKMGHGTPPEMLAVAREQEGSP